MHRQYHTDAHPVCGYDSCPCRDVHFISSYRGESDYCVDGRRVSVSDASGISPRATAEQIRKLGDYFLESYAEYCKWSAERRKQYGDSWPALKPFDKPYALPLRF